MVSRYSIVQYVPNPIADERINIGVLAFDDNRVCVRFLSNWERVKRFGMEDIHFLKDFASRMEAAAADGLLFPGDSPNETPKQERLIRVAQNWFNSIQLTEPRGSLDDVESLLADIADTCLLEPPEKPKPRDRAFAVQMTRRKIRNILGDRAKDLVKKIIHCQVIELNMNLMLSLLMGNIILPLKVFHLKFKSGQIFKIQLLGRFLM